MVMRTEKYNIQNLSRSERIALAEQLWDSVAENQDSIEITASQKEVLEDRLASYRKNPDEGSTWEEIKDEMK